MALSVPHVLILGHSFVRNFKADLAARFDPRVGEDFGLHGSANVHLYGVGGRTVSSLRSFNLPVICRTAPEVVILEIGTNDLSQNSPEVTFDIEDFACFLLREFRVRIVCICHVIPCGPSCRRGGASFNTKVKTLHEVLATLVESIQGFFLLVSQGAHEPCQDSSFTGWRSLKYFGPISPLS